MQNISPDERLLLELLKRVVQQNATDLHLSGGSPPILRIMGELVPLTPLGPISPEKIQKMIFSIMSGYQNEDFINKKELDFSYEGKGLGRFRINVMFERNSIGAVFRRIPDDPYSIDQLGVPKVMKKLCEKRTGLILVTGPSGSGKSTTLAACIDYINTNTNCHIVTIEDPIEYVHKNKKALIRQREVGLHTTSFASALRHCLRQDPDVILVGEMRDLETMFTTLSAAETGHLVFSTLHTSGAVECINRVVDVFPADQQTQVRIQLATSLEGVLSQTLIPKAKGHGMVLCVEVMVATPAVRNIIREGRLHTLRNCIETGSEYGMQTFEVSLRDLYLKGLVTYEMALSRALDVEAFKKLTGMGMV
ncbi:MAG: type IV pilus twitching motility protein PilT [Candidatus Eremiobacteraeota bacterium]|nr:type IV pilus twitching motility protein PilT [Candidatus Eremiobacteraeota bacterium]